MLFEKKNQPVLSHKLFLKRVRRSIAIGIAITLVSLGLGMIGYRYFEAETWIDAYLNAAMILSGMGEVNPLQTSSGKIFAGTYALFSGIVFLVVMAVVFSPVLHRFLHVFHFQEDDQA